MQSSVLKEREDGKDLFYNLGKKKKGNYSVPYLIVTARKLYSLQKSCTEIEINFQNLRPTPIIRKVQV